MEFTIGVKHPTVHPGNKSKEDPRWVFNEPYQVARGVRPNVEFGPTKPTAVVVTDENGETSTVTLDLSTSAKVVPGGETRCPVWGDVVPWKSVTVIVDAADEADARYSLEYVHGGGSVSRRMALPNGRVALRSNYQCW